jgi:hypothetical protein
MSIPEEIHYLSKLSGIRCSEFMHQIVGAKVAAPSSTTPAALLTYTPPENFTWLVTRIALRSIPTPQEATLGGASGGDWRSEDFDASGTAKAFIRVKDRSIISENTSYFLLFNRPVLFAFQGNEQIKIFIQRITGFVPPTEVVVIACNAYLAPVEAYDALAKHLTQIDAQYS